MIEISAVDPLNLTGVVTPGPRVPAQLGQRVRYLDGVPQGGGEWEAGVSISEG